MLSESRFQGNGANAAASIQSLREQKHNREENRKEEEREQLTGKERTKYSDYKININNGN